VLEYNGRKKKKRGIGMDVRKIRDDDGLEYVVNFEWDDEAKVWIATSDDIDGLVLESESP
jgi:hypothetical protein